MTGWEREALERRDEPLVLGIARTVCPVGIADCSCNRREYVVVRDRRSGELLLLPPDSALVESEESPPDPPLPESPPALEGPDLTQHRALADRLARETKEPHLVLPHGDNGSDVSCSRGWLPYVCAEPRASAWEKKHAVYRAEGGAT